MGGFYGKLLITAYIVFGTIMLGFILMCIVFGRKGDTTPPHNAASRNKFPLNKG
ncbi:MAG: hypothetical protein NG747_07730 [Candidatus Brocadia sp.]|nr:hypothetical protein [Candidatus Brocadia sp.]